MAGHASNPTDSATLWGGKVSPFSTSYGKLMMWFFLVSDALTFGGLLVSYGFTRHDAQVSWPIGEETFNSLPFLGHGYPLIYVALMTFILIVSSVTMVLAVEAGHRMDKKGVMKWMVATIIGGFFFVGSQAWEWYHFIHGSEFGKVELADGSRAIVKGHFGEIKNFTVVEAGHHHKKGEVIKDDLLHEFHHAILDGNVTMQGGTYMVKMHDGSVAKVNKEKDHIDKLVIKESGSKYVVKSGDKTPILITGHDAEKMYTEAITSGERNRVIYGADLQQNEYGPAQYGQFFFFITGFHGFHVFSGVIINIIIFLGVARGLYHGRGHYEMVEKTGLYWHFVDLVWVFVFTFFYLV
ncbi:MAG: cytochrome c oxidase subunit [Crocinitomicaceae bacterium]|jgi:cytochrome c oxidase subunit 3|nr:cytochrome c oxidase subunit [Crocinitomicaceae bacterium]